MTDRDERAILLVLLIFIALLALFAAANPSPVGAEEPSGSCTLTPGGPFDDPIITLPGEPLPPLLPCPPLSPKDCVPEPASPWAPAGWICPPHYGIGTASTWSGPGAATNWCTHALRDSAGCPPVTVRSLTTGRTITVVPTEWCHCWVRTIGPAGETERLIDLGPELVRALGLRGPGLYPVEVLPLSAMSDTATRERTQP